MSRRLPEKDRVQSQATSERRKRILVVDDEAHIREILKYQLESAGYAVCLASGGREALESVRSDPPDLVLLDLMMPLVDGYEVCRQLRGEFWTSHIPVIMITAKGDLEDKLEGLADGANDYITKPFAIAEVLVRIRNALEWSCSQREANPLTGLPGNIAITRQIDRRLRSDDSFAFIYADLDGFKAFNDHYGYCRGDAAISFTAKVLTAVVREFGNPDDFVGHVGGDDFAVLTSVERVGRITGEIIERFDEGVRPFFDREDLERGYVEVENRRGEADHVGLLAITLAVVTGENGPIEHVAEVSDIASELKCCGKRHEGSVVVCERRGAGLPHVRIPCAEMVP